MATESKASESKSDGYDNIQVVARCRPLNAMEKEEGTPSVVQVNSDANEVLVRGSLKRAKKYTFDRVYGQYSTQEEMFHQSVVPLIDMVMQGFNATVFAYGQTGTGKTYTMEGALDTSSNAGVIPRSVYLIFDRLKKTGVEFSVRVSFMELYNEQLGDLLYDEDVETMRRKAPGAGSDTPVAGSGRSGASAGAGASAGDSHRLRIVEDARKGTLVQGLEEVLVHTPDEAFEHLVKAVKKRQVAETILNKASSRSHSIFTLTIHTKETTPDGEDLLKVGKLNLVDLAGSECIGRSGAKNGRAREAGNINQSLLTLGRVITALVDHLPHVPYRDSKLTRLLQDSLGGRTKTCIIATLSPSVVCVDETVSTLDYANRAKNIKNRPVVNQKMTKRALIKEYSQEIERLKEELKCARDKHGVYLPNDRYDAMQLQLASQSGNIAELESVMQAHKDARDKLEADNAEVQAAFDAAAADVDLLHAKVQRKAVVEDANQEEAGAFAQETVERLDALTEDVARFSTAQRQEMDVLSGSVAELAAHRATETATLQQCVSSIASTVDEFVVDARSRVGTFVTDGAAEYDGLHTLVTEFKAHFSGVLDSAGAAIKAELQTMSSLFQRQQQHVQQLRNTVDEFAARRQEACDAFAAAHGEAVEKCNATVAAAFASVEDRLTAHRQQVEAAAAARKQAAAAANAKMVAALQEFAAAQATAIDEDAAAVVSSLAETSSQVVAPSKTATDAAVASAGAAATEFAAIGATAAHAHAEDVKGVAQQMADGVDACETARSGVATAIDETLATANTDVTVKMDAFDVTVTAARTRLSEFAGVLSDSVAATGVSVTDGVDGVRTAIVQGEAAFGDACEVVKGRVLASTTAMDGLVAAQGDWAANERMSLSNFVNDRLRRDVATGSTPKKGRRYRGGDEDGEEEDGDAEEEVEVDATPKGGDA